MVPESKEMKSIVAISSSLLLSNGTENCHAVVKLKCDKEVDYMVGSVLWIFSVLYKLFKVERNADTIICMLLFLLHDSHEKVYFHIFIFTLIVRIFLLF